jgi:hypothetical protein
MPVAMLGFGALVSGAGLSVTGLVTCLGFLALVAWALARPRSAQPAAGLV